ncbi:hypothetical protein, partial [Brevundimonas sp.]|uniref:hypothetical protein n=1 Tax=Brevundimonas sp. TaxID=1871086 RepID=UPI002ABBEDBD
AALFACTFAVPAVAQTTRNDGDTTQPTVSDGRSRDRNRRRQPPAMTPEEVKAMAQAQAASAGLSCQVTEAQLLGRDAAGKALFETVCESGPGYLILEGTPPIAQNCLELTAAQEAALRANPEAVAAQQCVQPLNLDTVRAVTPLAREAGVPCTVDAGRVIGAGAQGLIYEAGCANQDGYTFEKTAAGWETRGCLTYNNADACRFTTAQEQAAGFATKLAGTTAAACDVQQVLYMGGNANGQFYEAKCASGEGYVARIDAQGVAAQIYPCAEATGIGDGCTLTPVTAPAATTAPAE